MMIFDEFVKESYPDTWSAWLRYQKYGPTGPDVGTEVITLVSGFGGYGGERRIIKEKGPRYITLGTFYDEHEYLANTKHWYKQFKADDWFLPH